MIAEEAIDILDRCCIGDCELCTKNERHGGHCEGSNYAFSAIAEAQKALDKQIPKKPIIRKTEDYFGYVEYILCPNCEKVEFGHEHPCFCNLCGQAIDWEVNE